MKSLNQRIVILMAVLLSVGIAACNRTENEDSSQAEGSTQSSEDLLDGEYQDAVDLLIAIDALDSSFNPVSLSPDLQDHLSKYDGTVQFQSHSRSVTVPLIADGTKKIIPEGGEFGGTLEGALNAEILFSGGEVGIIEGEIYVSEGTKATIDGSVYSYSLGKWVRSNGG